MGTTSLAFDRYDLIKDLVASGMKQEHAESISGFIATGVLRAHEVADLATRADVQMAQSQTDAKIAKLDAKLDAKIDRVAAELDAKIDRVAANLDAKIDKVAANLDAKIDKEIAEVKQDIAEVKGELKLHRWMLGVIVATNMAILLKTFFGT